MICNLTQQFGDVKEASLQDYAAICQLINKAYWEKQKPFLIDCQTSRDRISLDDLKFDPNKKIFILRNSFDDLLGVIITELPEEESFAKFRLFAVDTSFNLKGLGQRLIDYVEKYAKEQGRTDMKIEVFTFATKLEAHYLKLGYYPTGKTFSFFHADCIKPEFQNSNGLYLKELSKIL